MINRKKKKNYDVFSRSYLVTGIFFAFLFAVCLFVFYSVTYEAAATALNFLRVVAYALAFVAAILICFRCAASNKLKNPDGFVPPRDMFYYLKRMGFIVLMLILLNIAMSLGVFWVSSFGIQLLDQIDDLFIRELIVKLPFFIVYLAAIYGIFQSNGFMDSQKKIYNKNFRILSVIVTFMTMVPGVVHDNFILIRAVEKGNLNIQAVLSPHSGIYTVMEGGRVALNENFSGLDMLAIIFAILFTFAVETAVTWFAYSRGRRRFIKDYLINPDEYDTNEKL